MVILMPAYIRFLRFLGMGKRILVEGPESHQVKEGTPTMGGLLLIGVVLALFFFLNDFVLPRAGSSPRSRRSSSSAAWAPSTTT